MPIGTKIRLFLVENNISQTWLSEQAKIALPKLNASLNNKRKLSVEEFSKIIIALETDANQFVGQHEGVNQECKTI